MAKPVYISATADLSQMEDGTAFLHEVKAVFTKYGKQIFHAFVSSPGEEPLNIDNVQPPSSEAELAQVAAAADAAIAAPVETETHEESTEGNDEVPDVFDQRTGANLGPAQAVIELTKEPGSVIASHTDEAGNSHPEMVVQTDGSLQPTHLSTTPTVPPGSVSGGSNTGSADPNAARLAKLESDVIGIKQGQIDILTAVQSLAAPKAS